MRQQRTTWMTWTLAGALVAAVAGTVEPTEAQVRVAAPTGPAQPTPRLPDGAPNLGPVEPNKGYWVPRQFQGYVAILKDATDIPYQPWARALADQRKATQSRDDPNGFCLPPGGPRMMTTPYPMEIIQLPQQKRIVMLFEGATHIWRNIYMDGRPHPAGDELRLTWLGHSVGRWDGDTLVIDTVGFNEGTWLDMSGKPHTDSLHLIERISRPNLMTLHYEATIDDRNAYTAAWTIAFDIFWDPDGEIQEYVCQENNRWMEGLMRQNSASKN